MIGVVAAKDLPAQPSEDEFRLGLRSGIILCNVINKIQPHAVSKVGFIIHRPQFKSFLTCLMFVEIK